MGIPAFQPDSDIYDTDQKYIAPSDMTQVMTNDSGFEYSHKDMIRFLFVGWMVCTLTKPSNSRALHRQGEE